MAFSPLQSRLVASLAATIFLLVLYFLLFAPHFALADDTLGSFGPTIVLDQPLEEDAPDAFQALYEPDFALFDRGIVGRQEVNIRPLSNNVALTDNIDAGDVKCFRFEKSRTRTGTDGSTQTSSTTEEEGTMTAMDAPPVRRQSSGGSRKVYISAGTCEQPHQTDADEDQRTPPQLTLLASFSSGGEGSCVRSTSDVPSDQWIAFEEGLATLEVDTAEDVYVSVLAPNVSSTFTGVFNFELAASTDMLYHSFNDTTKNPELVWMDSDSSAALLNTRTLTKWKNETEKYMEEGPPYVLYVENENWKAFDGIRHSACAISKVALIEANRDNVGRQNQLVRTAMTARGTEGLPRQQFYFEGLNATTTYNAILVKPMNTSSTFNKRQDGGSGEGTPGGGGTVFTGTNFTTLRGTTCKVVADLEFCDEVQYAVPGSDKFSNGTELARVYDDYARKMYSSFEKVMMQIACEADPTSQYSLVSNCDDCKDAYKRWLCTVAVPRCEDYTSPSDFAIKRNVGQPFPNGTMLPDSEIESLSSKVYHNVSRNRFIDEEIAPGPYKEILPCEEICYEVVQKCPAAIGFKCPRPKMTAFNVSYGRRDDEDSLACNYPGVPRTKVSAAVAPPPASVLLGVTPLLALGYLLI